jgi:hypothetical protein
VETNPRGKFLELPRTKLGWWTVGLGLLFVVLFLAVSNSLIPFPGSLTIAIGVAAGTLDFLAIFWKQERSWLIWLMLVPGLFAIMFAMGEILSPH